MPPLRRISPIDRQAGDGRTKQSALLVTAAVKDGHLEELEEILGEIAREKSGPDAMIPFDSLETVHFARFVLFEASKPVRVPADDRSHGVSEPPIGPMLTFAVDFDGPLEDQLADLAAGRIGLALARVFGHCVWTEEVSPENLAAFLEANRASIETSFVGAPGRTVDQIRREAKLREHIQGFLDEQVESRAAPTSNLVLRETIRAILGREPRWRWALLPTKLPAPSWWARLLLKHPKLMQPALGIVGLAPLLLLTLTILAGWLTGARYGVGAGVAAGLAVLAVLVALGLKVRSFLRRLSASDGEDVAEDKEKTGVLSEGEDQGQGIQNEISSVLFVKAPSWFRRRLLHLVLKITHRAAQHLFVEGALGGIRSIHFAHWTFVNDKRRLLFFSNFDGTWESYLGEFVDRAATGLTGVWSNCVGFPRTKGLDQEGAAREAKFKAYSRRSQTRAQVWYSAYPDLTILNINNNSRIRAGLTAKMTEAEAEKWAELL
jgi:hypothetical protein